MRGLREEGELQNLPCLLCSAVLVGGHRARSREQGADLEGSLGGPGALPRSTGHPPPDASLPGSADKGRWPKKDNSGEGAWGVSPESYFKPHSGGCETPPGWRQRPRGAQGPLFRRPLCFWVYLTFSTLYGEKGDAESFLWKA